MGRCMDRWMNGWVTHGWMNRWMNEKVGRWMDIGMNR